MRTVAVFRSAIPAAGFQIRASDMRDAKILQIYEGTNQIQRDIVGMALVKEYASA